MQKQSAAMCVGSSPAVSRTTKTLWHTNCHSVLPRHLGSTARSVKVSWVQRMTDTHRLCFMVAANYTFVQKTQSSKPTCHVMRHFCHHNTIIPLVGNWLNSTGVVIPLNCQDHGAVERWPVEERWRRQEWCSSIGLPGDLDAESPQV